MYQYLQYDAIDRYLDLLEQARIENYSDQIDDEMDIVWYHVMNDADRLYMRDQRFRMPSL